MIDFVEGIVSDKLAQAVVVKAGGVGFLLSCSGETLKTLPEIGEVATVYSQMIVKEDDISLYGFSTIEEREFFKLLISVNGVGPKMAIAILSAYPYTDIQGAIATGNVAILTSVSGVGKKTGERIILELKDKVTKGLSDVVISAKLSSETQSKRNEAISALMALGYSAGEINKCFKENEKTIGDFTTEELIKFGLRNLARL